MTGTTAKSKPKSSKIDETELGRLRKQDHWLQVGRAKLAMDLIFVCTLSQFFQHSLRCLIFVTAYELFEIGHAKNFVKASTGLASAVLRCEGCFFDDILVLDVLTLLNIFSSAKLYDRHKNALVKMILTSSS